MFGLDSKRINLWINYCQFKIGELFFPALEPFFRMLENRDPEVKSCFHQALKGLEGNNRGVALLHLNAALNLNPRHFMARVYRGRIYIRETRYREAAEDYMEANKINRYRFIHNDLYREYFSSLNKDLGKLSASIAENFGQAFEMLRQFKESRPTIPPRGKARKMPASRKGADAKAKQEAETSSQNLSDLAGFDKDTLFSKEERAKFQELGPITRKDIEETDWDELIKDLSSKTEEL